MISALRRLFGNTDATAAVEAAIFLPIFLALTLGVTDLGSGMFVQMTANAAAQSGATYAIINSGSTCTTLTTTCLNGIKTAMNDATGNLSFCTGSVCTASIASCADGSPKCITVSVNYPFTPILSLTSGPYAQSWTRAQTYSSNVTVRIL